MAYVRCQRCRRPTCPTCQRPAAVGIQCVDCIKEGKKSVRQGTTIFGGAVTDGRPLVTQTLMAICAVLYVAQLAGPFVGVPVTEWLLFVPALGAEQPWRFLTSAFVHSDWLPSGLMHIGFNMYILWLLGPRLETLLGRARFLALYLVSALGGSVMVLLLSWSRESWFTGTLGASGAVFGLFSALLVLQRRLRQDTRQITALIVINLVIGFVYAGQISWQGHIGGLVTGAACAAVMVLLGRRPDGSAGRGSWAVH